MSARKQGTASGAPTVHISTWGLLLGPNVTMEAVWEYDTADPWAVTFGVLTGCGWVRWRLDRELLAAGMLASSGVADVTVSPFPTGVFVTLRGEEQYAELLVYCACSPATTRSCRWEPSGSTGPSRNCCSHWTTRDGPR